MLVDLLVILIGFSTEDSFPELGDVDHCVADSNGKYSIPIRRLHSFYLIDQLSRLVI
jgi:hypothetical protein